MDLESGVRPTRRRGAELTDALLGAAWDQLVEHGYAGFTIDAVAQRAATSRAVLYRRWPSRVELLRATISHHGSQQDFELADTGTLRGDVLAALRRSNRDRSNFLVLLSASLGEYYAETGTSPREVRDILMHGRATLMDEIFERAGARGELDPATVPSRVRTLPFDLYRHEVLMTLRPVPDRVLEEIVDEVFLPLVTGR